MNISSFFKLDRFRYKHTAQCDIIQIDTIVCKSYSFSNTLMFHNLTRKEVFLERDKLNNRQRPYHVGTTGSRSITKVKLCRARLVLGWVTAWEHRVLLVSFFSSHVFYHYLLIFIILYTISYTIIFFSFFKLYRFC